MNCNVRNANYQKVLAVIEKLVNAGYRNMCVCPKCINDIAAVALNYLPPHYYVENEENAELGSPWIMVETAVLEAADRVIDNPNHGRDSSQKKSEQV